MVQRKEAAWKEVFGAKDKVAKKDIWKLTQKKKERYISEQKGGK